MDSQTQNHLNFTLCSPKPSSGLASRSVLVQSPRPAQCPPNHIVIKVDRFGFSANNITYQSLGEHPHFRYFDFHDAPVTGEVSPKTHGLIPVWSFGTVVISNHPKIHSGERVYGYLAPSRYLVVPVSSNDVNKYAFYVPRPHLPADRRPYNQIRRCESDPEYIPTPYAEDFTMLYRPLFWTSFWCEDWLWSSRYRGASIILISSASAKTAFCLAYLIKKRIRQELLSQDILIIGLTSKRNLEFTKNLRLYDEVLEYDTFILSPSFKGDRTKSWLYVDVAGNDNLNNKLLSYFASPYVGRLAACISLGMTNLSPSTSSSAMRWTATDFSHADSSTNPSSFSEQPSVETSRFWPRVEQFFMPEWLNVRRLQLSIAEISARQLQAWKDVLEEGKQWVTIERTHGAIAVQNAFEHVSKHGLGADKGLIWSLWDRASPTMARL